MTEFLFRRWRSTVRSALALLGWGAFAHAADLAGRVLSTRTEATRPVNAAEIVFSDSSVSAQTRDRAIERALLEKRQRVAPAGALTKLKGGLNDWRLRVTAEAQFRQAASPQPRVAGALQLQDMSQPLVARVAADGAIHVYVHTKTQPVASVAALRAAGMTVELTVPDIRVVQGWVPVDRFEMIAALGDVEKITLPDYAVRRTGSVNSQGDSLLKANLVRQMGSPGPFTGAGIKVGLISDGATNRASAIASGDLPPTMIVNPAMPGSGDEGTAMAEIVYDLAPGAQIYFAGPTTSAEMVTAIQWLVAQGCQVICDDLGFYGQPYFEDGAIAMAARNAVVTNGRVYVSAAGNDAQDHYQGVFADSGNGFHDFKLGVGVDTALDISVPAGATATVLLQWNDPFGGSANDYDLYLVDPTTGNVLASSLGEQIGVDDPFEVVNWQNPGPTSKTVLAYVKRYGGATRTLELFVLGGFVTDDDVVAADSIFGHSAVSEVISAGAINASTSGLTTVASYSSRGPSTISFPAAENRATPFITGVDGVSVTGTGGFPSPFYGTSASAPHVAAICALLLQRNPNATPAQIRAALAASAADRGATGFDNTYGAGLIDALAAVNDSSLRTLLITTQPQSQTVNLGAGATFTVAATGDPAPTFRWQRQPAGTTGFANLVDNAVYTGATTTTLRVAAATAAMIGDQFHCVVSNSEGSVTSSAAALGVNVLSGVIAVASGGNHTAFLRADGSFWTTGDNNFGQLGDGTTVNRSTPQQVASGVVRFSLGGYSTAFLKNDGSLWATGFRGIDNQNGTPVQFATNVIGVASGSYHLLFIKSDGSLWGLGQNLFGALGLNTGGADVTSPVRIDTHVAAVDANFDHTMYLKSDGTLWTMGHNSYAQLGDGTFNDRFTPMQVATGVIALSAGNNRNLFLKSDSTLWGMGIGITGSIKTEATPVLISGGVTAFAAGMTNLMFVKSNQTLWAIGTSSGGEFGNGSNSGLWVSLVQVASSVASVAIGGVSTWQIRTDGGLWASGLNNLGQLGDGTTIQRFTAVPVTGGAVPAPIAPASLTASRGDSSSPLIVSWSPSLGATTFEVWRGTSSDSSSAVLLARSVTLPRYEDLTAAVGVTYYYWVKAGNLTGTSGFSASDAGFRGDPPVFVVPPASRSIGAGGTVTLSVVVGGTSPTLQWRKNGITISGATGSSLVLAAVAAADAGSYDVVATNGAASTTSATAVLTVLPNPIVYSSRQFIGAGGASAYLAIEGNQTKHLLLRAVGPTLANYSVSNPLLDPQITVFDSHGAAVANNDNWGTVTGVDWPALLNRLGASALNPGSADAALHVALAPGAYQVRVSGVRGATGVALLELFDTDTNSATRVAYVGIRGGINSTIGGISAGVTITNSAAKRLLLRAVGPTLADPAGLADPQLQVLDGSTPFASNDNWGNNPALTTAANQAGAFPLGVGSADAAVLVNTRVGTGAYTAVVPPTGAGGEALLEIYDLNAAGIPAYAPLVVMPPLGATVSAGNPVTLRVVGVGLGGAAYQWRKNGSGIAAATTPTLSFLGQTADTGSYDVRITTPLGTATSGAASVTVTPAVLAGTHAVVGAGYFAGGTVTITTTFTYPSATTALNYSVTLPAGWSYAGGTDSAETRPSLGATGMLEWAWTALPPLPVTFTYTLNVPASHTGAKTVTASLGGSVPVTPQVLTINPVTNHSADSDKNFRVSLLELTRVIELYNTRNGSTRTGCYSVATATTEDGFQADPTRTSSAVAGLSRYHSGDSNQDGKLSLLELTRMIELYNYRAGTSRTGQYHMQFGTEDGFDPGP